MSANRRLSRFLHVERPKERSEAPAHEQPAAQSLPVSARFQSVDTQAKARPANAGHTPVPRFIEPEQKLELAERPPKKSAEVAEQAVPDDASQTQREAWEDMARELRWAEERRLGDRLSLHWTWRGRKVRFSITHTALRIAAAVLFFLLMLWAIP